MNENKEYTCITWSHFVTMAPKSIYITDYIAVNTAI